MAIQVAVFIDRSLNLWTDWFRTGKWKQADPRLVTCAVGIGGLVISVALTALFVMLMDLCTPAPVLIGWVGLSVAALRGIG